MASRAHKNLAFTFTLTVFVSAALLFWVQPLVAKMLLPLLGGTPAVWNTCMLFFQAMLLAGYFYVFAVSRWLTVRQQSAVHLAILLLAALCLPFTVSEGIVGSVPAGGSPVPWLLGALALMAGAPFFILSTTAPLLQKWFSKTGHPSARDPYFLYAASNAGSLLSLLAFPLLLEPNLAMRGQSGLWGALYAALALLLFACASLVWKAGGRLEAAAGDAPPASAVALKDRLLWTALAFAPSSLMLGVTTYISVDVAAVPLLWVIPLSIYLVTFVLVFASRQILSLRLMTLLLPGAALLVGLDAFFSGRFPVWVLILIHLTFFFVAAMVCHGRLAKMRPPVEHLAEYYLWIAVGGALGGVFNVIVAPNVFNSVAEYSLVMLLACLLSPRYSLPLFLGVATLCGRSYVEMSRPNLHAERSFFGLMRVTDDPENQIRLLFHGSTVHGKQFLDPSRSCEPLAYFDRTGPAGSIFASFNAEPVPSGRVAIIGLGAGSMAAYSRPDQRWTFYEIDPAVIRIASDPRYFTYLRNCAAAPVEMVVGDARLRLREAPDDGYDLIALDAFSSDSVPTHLLTREALKLYLSKLAPEGLLAFHISNRNLNLRPLVAALAKSENLTGYGFLDKEVEGVEGKEVSYWIVMARSPRALAGVVKDPRWRPLEERAGMKVWTDDFSNILSVFNWR